MYQLFSLEQHIQEYPILTTDCQSIINFVSCDAVMGYKLGARLKAIHPEMYDSYKKACLYDKTLTKGKALVWRKSNPWIINIPVKETWKDSVDPEYLEEGIEKLSQICSHFKIQNIAIQENYINHELLLKALENVELPQITFYKEKKDESKNNQ